MRVMSRLRITAVVEASRGRKFGKIELRMLTPGMSVPIGTTGERTRSGPQRRR
jgi:hypothetical protein